MIRSMSDQRLARMREHFRAVVEAAGRATGCGHEVVFSAYTCSMRNNRVLVDRFAAHMAAYGVPSGPPDPQMGSTDMGNVSHVVPAIHPNLAICEPGVPRHSIEFRERARSPRADEATLLAAILIAQVAYEVLADPALREAAWADFRVESA
jgi:metal-dependent amidase/aminoacylase/carboxypeptidase family protein